MHQTLIITFVVYVTICHNFNTVCFSVITLCAYKIPAPIQSEKTRGLVIIGTQNNASTTPIPKMCIALCKT